MCVCGERERERERERESLATASVEKINIISHFKNLAVKLYVFYILNSHLKFHVNQILFTT